jgi:flavin reductase (DIM6/NTAB) family NADH-FMN oxidoreductase RutF
VDTMSPVTEPKDLRKVFSHYPSGVAAISATIEGSDTVLVSSSFTVGVSLEPPLVMFAVQKTSQSWPQLSTAPRLGVSVLSELQGALCRQLAGDRETRFRDVESVRTDAGSLFITDAAIWLDCSLYAEHEAGDHTVALLQVHSVMSNHDLDPLVFHSSRFRPMS